MTIAPTKKNSSFQFEPRDLQRVNLKRFEPNTCIA